MWYHRRDTISSWSYSTLATCKHTLSFVSPTLCREHSWQPQNKLSMENCVGMVDWIWHCNTVTELGLSDYPSEGNRTFHFTFFFWENRTFICIEKHETLYSAQHFDIALVEVIISTSFLCRPCLESSIMARAVSAQVCSAAWAQTPFSCSRSDTSGEVGYRCTGAFYLSLSSVHYQIYCPTVKVTVIQWRYIFVDIFRYSRRWRRQ